MKIIIFFASLFMLSISSCNYERNNIIEKSDGEIEHNIKGFRDLKSNTNCGSISWKNFPLIIGVQYDKIILSGISLNYEVSLQKVPWGKPDSVTFYDENIYDDMSDYQKWHYGESMLIIYKNEIIDFYINENNFVLNQPMYVEIGKTKCNDFKDYINCDCENILDKNGNGTIIINIIASEVLIVTDAHLFFVFKEYHLKRFGLNSRIF